MEEEALSYSIYQNTDIVVSVESRKKKICQ